MLPNLPHERCELSLLGADVALCLLGLSQGLQRFGAHLGLLLGVSAAWVRRRRDRLMTPEPRKRDGNETSTVFGHYGPPVTTGGKWEGVDVPGGSWARSALITALEITAACWLSRWIVSNPS